MAFTLQFSSLFSQELFPLSDNASNVPKGVLGLRVMNNSFIENGTLRNLNVVRLMYGMGSKFSIYASWSASNHHGVNFPNNLVTHTHTPNGVVYSTGSFQRGLPYPYLFNGMYLYGKYRFLTYDRQNEHLRAAVYGEWSGISVAHDEAEPNLVDDTGGWGAGLILTYLKNKFAVSLTGGAIIPKMYEGLAPDPISGQLISTEVIYGRALKYNLSFGYLIYPKVYESYKQTNWNIYLEFIGKSYEDAKVYQYGGTQEIPINTPLLLRGSYLDICPGIQAIINSNTRIDLSLMAPLIKRSYSHFYPVVELAVQHYFFRRAKNHD